MMFRRQGRRPAGFHDAVPIRTVTSAARMTSASAQTGASAHANRRKCVQCGLVNFAANDACRRCGAALAGGTRAGIESAAPPSETVGVGRRIAWLIGVTVALIFLWSRSLLLTSDPIDANQRGVVLRAIEALEQQGFTREVLVLRHFANYRSTDNWWNQYLGHANAYAATNFPLGVVTLYRPFFAVTADDTERAIILLHEAQHLWGSGEETALKRVWRDKGRVGWTAEKYRGTRVWTNTREWTAAAVPSLFACGADGRSDCAP